MADIRSGYVLNYIKPLVYHGTFPESERLVRLNKWEIEEQLDTGGIFLK